MTRQPHVRRPLPNVLTSRAEPARRHDAWRTLAEAVLFFGAVAVIVAAMSLGPV